MKGGGVETDEVPHNNILEAEAVSKGRLERRDFWVSGKGVADPKQRSVLANQPDEAMMLIAKATEKLMGRKATSGKTMANPARRGGRTRATAPRHEEPAKEGSVIFFFDVIALRARGRKQGQCRPPSGGRHLHGSPVRAQTCWW